LSAAERSTIAAWCCPSFEWDTPRGTGRERGKVR
jgi:hypothetical protein